MLLKKIIKIHQLTKSKGLDVLRLATALLFIVCIILFIGSGGDEVSHLLIVAAVIGGYMAMNIGANDVANNVGPAVGSRAMTLTGAIFIAIIFESAGALIAGGEVVGTIKKGIIDPAMIANVDTFVWLMMAALLAGALWLNLATALGAPVSTTHSIVGGVLGAGIAAGGWGIANWSKMSQIAASWVISPVLGGIIAAAFLYFIKRSILANTDMIAASKRRVPILVAIMAWAFGTYLITKGLKKIWPVDISTALLLGCAIAVAAYLIARPLIAHAANRLENSREDVDRLFTIPLVIAAALLSFAHGANDVANAIGPLAAINDAISSGEIALKASVPLWVMVIGALGIAIGLALYGPKLIRTVGSEITELNRVRAFCVALSAAITVIIATHFGLPVSSTHIAVGAIFGVGFLREYLMASYARIMDETEDCHKGSNRAEVEAFVARFELASLAEKSAMVKELKRLKCSSGLKKKQRKALKKMHSYELVKRSALFKIAAAWVITVPVSGLLAAMLFFMIRGMMLP